MRKKTLVDRVFGKLTVVGFAGFRQQKQKVSNPDKPAGKAAEWFCRCECGTTKTVLAINLISGRTISCGCSKKIGKVGSTKPRRYSKKRAGSSSQYHGVARVGTREKWRARIFFTSKKYKDLGLFDSEIEAAKAYNQNAIAWNNDPVNAELPKMLINQVNRT
jgi:hypothetical protein